MLIFGNFLQERKSTMNVLGKDSCLEIDEGQLERVRNDIKRLVDQIEATSLLLSIVAKNEVLLVSVSKLQDSWLALPSNEIVDNALGVKEDKAFIRDPASTLYCLMELLHKGESLLIAILIVI